VFFNKRFTQENLMAKTVADVMKMVKENEVKFVDFRFTDTRGKAAAHHGACLAL
jgi:hypothetical protein